MIDYLNQIDPPIGSIIKTSEYINLFRYMRRDLKNVLEYYRQREVRVRSSHFLARYIKSFLPTITLDGFSYLANIEKMLAGNNKHFDISASYSKWGMRDDRILGSTDSIFMEVQTHETYFNIDDWRNQTPIKPIYIDTTDIFMPHPTKATPPNQTVIYEVDSRLLLLMYREWGLERQSMDKDIDVSTFVYQYVLTNMIPHLLDHAVVNIFFNGVINKTDDTHPFMISDLRKKTIEVSRRHRKKVKSKRSLEYVNLLYTIEVPTNGIAYELFRTHGGLVTSNNIMPTILSRGRLYKDMFTFYKKDNLSQNRTFVRRTSVLLGRLNNLHTAMPEDLTKVLEELTTITNTRGE